jgi:DNA-binding IclR family transcriptional regulator
VSVQIQSIERAATVLRLLATRSGRRGVAELAGELELPKGTVYGILRTLQTVGFVEQDHESGKYQLGPALLHIGSRYLESNELRLRGLRWSETLADQTGEAVSIGAPHETMVLVVHQAFRPHGSPRTLAVGSLVPVHATALGKALLANRPDLANVVAGRQLASYTPATVSDPAALNAQLQTVAGRGWADEVEELLPGVASIAAPIESRQCVVIGAIAVSGPIERICVHGSPRRELVDQVMDSARAISRELGWSAW